MFSLYSAAFTAGGKFNNDWFGCFDPVNTNVPSFNGVLQVTGKLSPAAAPKTASLTIAGVWSDPTDPNGCSVNPADATFKGTLTAKKQ